MMITIHGLAPKTKYQDVKTLIKQECNIGDFILDNLVTDTDGLQKVRVGLPDDSEGYKLMKCLNGYRMAGNFVLKLVPVGKAAPNIPHQSTFDSRPGFQNQPRNDYPPRNDYMGPTGPNEFNRGQPNPPRSNIPPHGSTGPHAGNKSYGSGGPPVIDNVRPSPWTSNNGAPGQWQSNPPMATQIPQNTFNYGSGGQPNMSHNYNQQHPNASLSRSEPRGYDQGRQAPPAEQNFGGYPPKSSTLAARQVDLRQNLRNIDVIDNSSTGAPSHSSRYAPTHFQQDKPGPTQYNINHPEGQESYQQPGAPASWQPLAKPQFSKSNPMGYQKPFDDRKYPPTEQVRDPKNIQPLDTYKEYEKRRGYSPSREVPLRRRSPGKEDISRVDTSNRREVVVHREVSDRVDRPTPSVRDPVQRRVSPVRRDDLRYSPSRKMVSPPPERRNIPGHSGVRHDSPPKPLPGRRLASPLRNDERQSRYSPTRHHSDEIGHKYGPDGKGSKKVRPAYEPGPSHAQNQPMYSGGYRPSGRENAPYPAPGPRQEQPGPWQRPREEHAAPMKKLEDDRRDVRMQMLRDRERIPEQADKRFSPTRKSRSPNRRDRSPIREHYKRNSPSPRWSNSPRRSWALEKRRSPDAPPPPVWPGPSDHTRPNRPALPDKEEKPKHQPVWETRPFKEEDSRSRRLDERRPPFDDGKPRIAKDMMAREPAPQPSMKDRYQREPKFTPREEFDERRDNYRHRETPERKSHREVFDIQRRQDNDGHSDYNRRRESPHHERQLAKHNVPKDIDKDFEDIYTRTVELKRKTEERKKSASKKRDDFDGRISEKDKEDIRRRFEERERFREEELRRLREREERREDRPRDDRLRDDRPRDERARDDRPRDDRLRDDMPRDNRARHDDDHHGEYRPRDDQQDNEEQGRSVDITKTSRLFYPNSTIRQRRDKAIEEIARKIIDRSEDCKHTRGEQRQRIIKELELAVARIVYDMFGAADVSFIEIIIKYQARYALKDEAILLQNVMQSLPKQFRIIKRHAPDTSDIPAKTSRLSPSTDVKQETAPRPKLSDSNFNVNLAPPSVVSMPCIGISQAQSIMHQHMIPMMVPAPFYQLDNMHQNIQDPAYAPQPVQPVLDFPQPVQPVLDFNQPVQQPSLDFAPSFSEESTQEGYSLYLCKDDFERITNMEADLLKNYLISQMFQATAHCQGWAPDFTLKGLQSLYRYELLTKDEQTKDWLLNLSFSDFSYFNVLVYTKEELWYERAAIWLPGHSRVKNIEPLDKLKLQNKKLEGVNIKKWKFVKKLVNEKGTRLYVDMPPSSARALEGHGMKLSYELQQVSVIPKAAAVDKMSYDAGLKQHFLVTPEEISNAIKNQPMPSLTNDPSLVKIILRGSKTLNLDQARKIKETVVYHLFRYHQQDGISRTDFEKYGFLPPNYFAIVPKNQESKKWLMGCSFGKINKQAVVVIGGEEDNTRFFRMYTSVPQEDVLRPIVVIERLKSSNKGVRGINFSMWKIIKLKSYDIKKARFEVDIDMESLETLSTMQYQLDYVDSSGLHTLYFRSDYSQSGLEELVKRYKAEMTDSYDVANMDLESDQSGSESNDDVICLD